jgi:hypothetical protein
MLKANGDPTPSNLFNIRATMTQHLTPTRMLAMAYKDASNAIEFCNWYIQNAKVLEQHEQQLINMAYHDGINDAIQDPDHTAKADEYFKDNYGL